MTCRMSLGIAAILGSAVLPAIAASNIAFSVPEAESTWGVAINNNGDVAGTYIVSGGGPLQAFVRTSGGRIAPFDVPGATDTIVSSINDQGTIAGTWDAQSGGYIPHGFFRSAAGVITTFDPPGSVFTQSALISNNGSIAGG